MIHWDHEAKRRKLSARLKALPPHALLVFATVIFEHACDVVLRKGGTKAVKAILNDVVRAAWAAAQSDAPEMEDLIDRLDALQPDEDDAPPPGIADLLDGAAGLCALLSKPSPRSTSSLASYAYQAVLDRFIDREASWGGEDDFAKAERATPQAAAEIAFQYAALSAIEPSPGARGRSEILATVERLRASNDAG